MTKVEQADLIRSYDPYYRYSDDMRVFTKHDALRKQIEDQCRIDPEFNHVYQSVRDADRKAYNLILENYSADRVWF